MDRKSSRFADSVRPEVSLRKGTQCSLKKHYSRCLRQYVGYVDFLAARDPERERFVWASERDIARHCKKYAGGKPDEKPYNERTVRNCKKFLRSQKIIGEQVKRLRYGVMQEGFIVAEHDSLTKMSGNRCVFLGQTDKADALTSSLESSLLSSPQSSVASSVASSPQNNLEFRSEFRSEFPSESRQAPQNMDTCGDGEKVCREFAESLATSNPVALKSIEPSILPTVRNSDKLRDGMAGIFSNARPNEKLNWVGLSDIETLAAECGNDTVLGVWRRWLKTRDTYGMKFHLKMFRKEFAATRADLERIEREEKESKIAIAAAIALDDARGKREREENEREWAAEEAEIERQCGQPLF